MRRLSLILFAVFVLFNLANPAFSAESAWKNSMEFSLLTTGGNSRSQTYGLKANNIKTKDKFVVSLNGGVFNSKTNGSETANNWFVNLKEEFFVTKKLYLYDLLGVTSDKYAGFNYRYSAQGGFGYRLLKTDKDELKSELGIDFTSEKRIGVENKNFLSGRYYLSYVHNYNKTNILSASADYLYDFNESENWRSNGELSFSAKLKDNLSLKTGVSYKFANLPVSGKGKTDTQTSTALILDF